ncbi:unnamed protein product [Ectocarpus sp. 6 AP-2014]
MAPGGLPFIPPSIAAAMPMFMPLTSDAESPGGLFLISTLGGG